MIQFKKDHYPTWVSWDDVIKKLDSEFTEGSHYLQVSGGPSDFHPRVGVVCHNNYFPNSIGHLVTLVQPDLESKYDYCDVDMYVSFCKDACNHGRHCDDKDVLIVQAIGRMEYGFDNGKIYVLDPGDSIFIPKGVYHNPTVHSPRATLSFGLL